MKTVNLKYISVAAVMVLLLCGFWWRPAAPRVAYIDNMKVFDAFLLKQKLEAELKTESEKRQFTLDSLKLKYADWTKHVDSVVANGKPAGDLLLKTRQFESYIRSREQELEQANADQANDFDKKIWQQLNQYVAAFGEEKEYDIVFGTNGDGNIMYGKKHLDKTAEVIVFVNEKYLGKK